MKKYQYKENKIKYFIDNLMWVNIMWIINVNPKS